MRADVFTFVCLLGEETPINPTQSQQTPPLTHDGPPAFGFVTSGTIQEKTTAEKTYQESRVHDFHNTFPAANVLDKPLSTVL